MIAPKRFCFDDPLLPCGTIWDAHTHCTHLQIAQANPQAKICKRVQLSTLKHFHKLTMLTNYQLLKK